MKTARIRQLFLQFFQERGHLLRPSDSLLPDDPTLMFSSAGMVQFKPYFLGATPRFPGVEGIWPRVSTAQKCLRIGDIENVGRTARHNSFFEMLGNFSFGDYFKRETILWAWEFLTSKDWLGLDSDKLFVTIYLDDEESYDIWHKEVGLAPEKIFRFGESDNFWPADAPSQGPNGPCGPCSEIFYDRGPDFGDGLAETGPNQGSGDRFVEIWNLVFTQFDRQDGGILSPLPQKNIDTGMGLYRIAPIMQNKRDFYEIDVFYPLIEKVVELTGAPYEGPKSLSHRVLAEHARAVTFTLNDGAIFANTGAGYVIRRLARRAIRHAYKLGARQPLLYQLIPLVVELMRDGYPELIESLPSIERAVLAEEKQFLRTLESGLGRFENILVHSNKKISGHDAFTLSDTYGFPLDLTIELAEEKGLSVDTDGFKLEMQKQVERAREGSKFGKGALFEQVDETLDNIVRDFGATEFIGYEQNNIKTEVLAILKDGQSHFELTGEAEIILKTTPFYAEGGGQVGDNGILEFNGGKAAVIDTKKTAQGIYLHRVNVLRGTLNVGDVVEARVAVPLRSSTERHHTATHLLHAALRAVLGPGVRQAGSLVTAEKLRFDFTHAEQLTNEQIIEIENLVNRFIQANFAVNIAQMPIEEARKAGAMALFGEKYGETVRVVSVDGEITGITSKELCGGCHVAYTGEIGAFVIQSQEGTAAGVRRIEAVCGESAIHFVRENLDKIAHLANRLGTSSENVEERILKLQEELKQTQKIINELKNKLTQSQLSSNETEILEFNGFKLVKAELNGLGSNELRTVADDLMAKNKADIIVVGSGTNLVVKASKDAVNRGAHAGQLIAKLAEAGGGKGGGRPDMAQAGVKDLENALKILKD